MPELVKVVDSSELENVFRRVPELRKSVEFTPSEKDSFVNVINTLLNYKSF